METHQQPASGLGQLQTVSEASGWLLGSIWRARWLLLQWSKRDFTVQYRQSLLGVLWAVVQPLLLLALYGVIFEGVLGIRAPHGSYIVFALCGLTPWTFIASVIGRSSTSILNAYGIIRQVYFPRAIVPLASTGITVVDLAISTGILLLAQVITAGTLHVSTLALIPLYLGLILLMSGVSVFVALAGALVRDVRFLIPLILQIGFIATPIMYPSSRVPGRFGWLYNLNPVGRVIEAIRSAVIDGRWPSLPLLVGLVAAGALVLVASLWYSSAVEDRLPDLL